MYLIHHGGSTLLRREANYPVRMIVCLCRGVQEGAVTAAITGGASTLDELVAACTAGSDCGACRISLLEILAACLHEKRQVDSDEVAVP